MSHPFISWLTWLIDWLFFSIGADRFPEEIADEEKKPVALVTQNGKPALPPQTIPVRPFWRKLNDQKNKRAFRRKKGRESRKAWRRP